MSERFVFDTSVEKPERGSPLEVINEYNEVKDLMIWLLQEDSNADPALRAKKRYRLNLLFMKHELSPGDMVESAKELKAKADRALIELKNKM